MGRKEKKKEKRPLYCDEFMPKLVLGMQMCLRLSELNHPFWEEGGGERGKKKKKYDTEGTPGECEMRVCCPSSRALPAAELAHGQAAGKRWDAARKGGPRCVGAVLSGGDPSHCLHPPRRGGRGCLLTIAAASCALLLPAHAKPGRKPIRCDMATLVPLLPSARCPPAEIRRVLPLPPCSPPPAPRGLGRALPASQGCSPRGVLSRGEEGRGERRKAAASGREEGCRKRCEPTANWAVVSVVWRLLLTTRYN